MSYLPPRTRRLPKYLADYYVGDELKRLRFLDTNLHSTMKKKNRKAKALDTKRKRKQKLQSQRAKSTQILTSFAQNPKANSKKNTESAVRWQYYDNGWYDYDPDASEIVEQQYQSWLKNPGDFDVRSVHSGHFHYMVDFRQMKQQNIEHENHTIRDVRRVSTL